MRLGTFLFFIFLCSTAYTQVPIFNDNTFGIESQYSRFRLADNFGALFFYTIKGRVAINGHLGYYEEANGLDGYRVVPGLEVALLKTDDQRIGVTLSSSYEVIQFTASSSRTIFRAHKGFSIAGNLFTNYELSDKIKLIPVVTFGSYIQGVLDSSKEGFFAGVHPTLVHRRLFFRAKLFYHRKDFFGGFGIGIGL